MEAHGLVGGGADGHVGAGERGHVGRVQVRDDGGEALYGTLKADTDSDCSGGDRIYGFEGNDLLRGNPGNDEAVGYVDGDPGFGRVYLDDKDRYTTDCEMITPVDSHPRSERAGAG